MPTYPAYLICPQCQTVACNLAEIPPALVLAAIQSLKRHLQVWDDGRIGPSNHVIVCQGCKHAFFLNQARLRLSPRTIESTKSTTP